MTPRSAAAPSLPSKTGAPVALVAAVAALAGFVYGFDSAVINGATEAIRSQFDVGAGPLGFAVASALIGAAIGAFLGGAIADRIGRIAVMKLAAALFLISAIGSGIAPEINSLIIFRVIGGFGMGIASIIAPAYIAEIAPAHIRGRLGSLQQLAIVIGIFLSQLVNKVFADLAGGSGETLWWSLEAWRWMLLIEAVPVLGYLIGAYLIPESPRYLVATQRANEARQVLTRFLGPQQVEASFERIRDSLQRDRKPSMRDIRGAAAGLKPIVWIGIALAVFQQFVGINVVFYYSNTLWQSVGFTEEQSFLFSLISATINVSVTIAAILLIDRIGRKPLLVVGSLGMAVTLGIMAIIFAMAPVTADGPVLEGAAGPIALVSANLFVVCFGISWGPVVLVMLGEMFPNRVRAAGLAVAGLSCWVANFLVTQTFPALAELSLGLAYGLYASFALLSFLFVVRFLPETKARELEDMSESAG